MASFVILIVCSRNLADRAGLDKALRWAKMWNESFSNQDMFGLLLYICYMIHDSVRKVSVPLNWSRTERTKGSNSHPSMLPLLPVVNPQLWSSCWLKPERCLSLRQHLFTEHLTLEKVLLVGAATGIIYFCRETRVCRDKHVCHDKACYWSQQQYACRSKTFLATKLCLSRQIFVATNMCLSPQTFCLNKHTFVTTKDTFCYDKHVFVATKACLSWQNFCCDKIVCRDKYLLWQNFCHDKNILLRQT